MNIGDRLRQLRISQKLTQEEVGRLMGVSKATVNRYETGEIDIKRTTALKLGSILNVSPAYIMGWTDTMDVSNEPEILKRYNSLNSLGKQKADDYINDLLVNPNYTVAETGSPNSISDELRPLFKQTMQSMTDIKQK